MKKLSFSIFVTATKERVWDVLWNKATYPEWTSAFNSDSRMTADWKVGGKVLFTGENGDGLCSEIAALEPHLFVAFRHLGWYKNGIEDIESAESEGWAGAMEDYTLTEEKGGITLLVTVETADGAEPYFLEKFPLALDLVKKIAEKRLITPFLWFDERIEAAVNRYTTAFPNAAVLSMARHGDTVFTASFSLGGQVFSALNGGPRFTFNPAISFTVMCETLAELNELWTNLLEGGKVLMTLQAYPWSEQYGWLQDEFGVNWQISLGKVSDVGQKITPSLLFVDGRNGQAEAAMQHYLSVFKSDVVDGILHYGPGQHNTEGYVQHAQFGLGGQKFMVMDGGNGHNYTFNEACSFVISCETQEEVDYYWEQLTSNGGEESQCAWLKDKFGVSWQVVPSILPRYITDPNPVKANNVMQAMLQMRKIDIALLQEAYDKN